MGHAVGQLFNSVVRVESCYRPLLFCQEKRSLISIGKWEMDELLLTREIQDFLESCGNTCKLAQALSLDTNTSLFNVICYVNNRKVVP